MLTATLKTLIGGAVVLAVVLGAAFIAGQPAPVPDGIEPPVVTPTPSVAGATHRSVWVPFTSEQYGFDGAYPDDWTVTWAQRDWTNETDAADPVSPGHDAFLSPDGDVRVTAWSMPFDGRSTEDSFDFEGWIEAYCLKTGNTPCSGIHARAVPLCIERRDCHPALLVPFENDVQAFLSGGIFGDRMTVVAAWRGESDPSVVKYGGSRHLLEAFLSTMGVWPTSAPLYDRVARDVPVTPSS